MSDPVLSELVNVTVTREDGRGVVAEHVNWQIAAGDFWVIAGDQGSGKTGLLQTAAGLLRPGAGVVRLFGDDVAEAGEEQHLAWRKRVGFVFENGGRLLNHLTVAGNIELPLLYHGGLKQEEATERTATLLQEAGLTGAANRLPSRLGPATQQRVAWLRAIAAPKELILVDHPLAPRWWVQALGQWRERAQQAGQPVAVVVTTTDFRSWADVGTAFAVLRQGEFRPVGPREQLLASEDAIVQEFR